MRSLLIALCLLSQVGCRSLMGDVGWRFEVDRPSRINVPVLMERQKGPAQFLTFNPSVTSPPAQFCGPAPAMVPAPMCAPAFRAPAVEETRMPRAAP